MNEGDESMAAKDSRTEIEQIARKYAQLLKSELDVKEVYWFGSFVKGNGTADSDIDIAVIGDDFTGDLIEDTFQLLKLRRQVDYRIEPHPILSSEFNDDHPLAKSIMEEGIKI
jgi:uncharacterized protein